MVKNTVMPHLSPTPSEMGVLQSMERKRERPRGPYDLPKTTPPARDGARV